MNEVLKQLNRWGALAHLSLTLAVVVVYALLILMGLSRSVEEVRELFLYGVKEDFSTILIFMGPFGLIWVWDAIIKLRRKEFVLKNIYKVGVHTVGIIIGIHTVIIFSV